MRIAMIYPLGPVKPGTIVDVDPALGDVLVREKFARLPAGSTSPAKPRPPTVREVMAHAREHGLSTTAARDALAEQLATRAAGATTPGGPA